MNATLLARTLITFTTYGTEAVTLDPGFSTLTSTTGSSSSTTTVRTTSSATRPAASSTPPSTTLYTMQECIYHVTNSPVQKFTYAVMSISLIVNLVIFIWWLRLWRWKNKHMQSNQQVKTTVDERFDNGNEIFDAQKVGITSRSPIHPTRDQNGDNRALKRKPLEDPADQKSGRDVPLSRKQVEAHRGSLGSDT
ncbi:hypothetical protein H2198_003629 [Neophaeococcomyces mojaviensis]|uniref:Uncharacterized protein n=1 Tax=Neophaeococcomyces mojaviensis TaxID=3383035 RepID=A0ACC3ABE6_9EURO|nr:hypothetical protein H2198_003629 [Knufia sp. JES_112]